jgi:pimeloyl-ACP methyl ester carboxylesterase
MQEKIYFSNSKGNKICGILSNPTSELSASVIILCHGFITSKDNYTNTKLEQIFNKQKITTFRFDFFGHGESEGNFENITISEAVDDILNAIKYLKDKGFSKIGLVGSSFGGTASINAASKTNELFVWVLKCPVSNYLERELQKPKEETEAWKNKGFVYKNNGKKLNYSFFEDIKNNDGYEAAKKIKIPTLIVHGDEDKTVSVEQSKKTTSLIENCKLEIIDGAGHKFNNPGEFEKMLDLISKFIIKHI